MNGWLTALEQYGMLAVLAGLAGFCWWMTQMVFRENAKREDRLASVIENHLHGLTNAVADITKNLVEHRTMTRELFAQMHTEHKEMIEAIRAVKTR